jgi:hypothetical protein
MAEKEMGSVGDLRPSGGVGRPSPIEDEERKPWERLPEESADAFQAFCDYRVMRKASVPVLHARYHAAKALGGDVPSTRDRTLVEWSRLYHWVERRKAWLDFQAECEAEAAAQEAARIGSRQARDAAKLQGAAMSVLDLFAGFDEETGTFIIDSTKFSAIDIARLWKTGFEAERALAGQASLVVERKVRDLGELSDEELDELIAE